MNKSTKLVHAVTGKRAEVFFEGTQAWCWEEGWSQGAVADSVGGESAGKELIERMTSRGGWQVVTRPAHSLTCDGLGCFGCG